MNKMGFRQKMIAAMLLLTALGILFISGMSYMQFRNQSVRNYVDSIDSQASIQLNKFDATMKETYLNMIKVSCSEDLKKTISDYIDSERDFQDGQKVSDQMKELLTMGKYNSTLYLYIPKTSEMFSTQDYYSRQKLDRSNILIWRKKQDEAFKPLFFMNYFTGSAEYVFGYACTVTDEKTGYEGYLCLTLNERQIYYDLLAALNNNTNGEEYFLVTDKGLVCSSEKTELLGCLRKDRSFMNGSRMSVSSVENRQMLYSMQSHYTGYYLLCQSDMRILSQTLDNSLRLAAGVLFFSLIVLIFAAVTITGQMYSPIQTLVETMHRIQEGDFEARVSETGMNDEFATMAHGFNDLMDHIDQLMDHIIQERTEKREAEINALQYQIRPHFMYNTLNSIRFAAQLQRNQKLADLLGDFTELLEASIQRKGAFVTMQEEIELVKHFLALQAFRYFECFETEFEVAPEAENCYVPCLLMQPMVENAVFHGIDTTRNDNLIRIKAWVEDSLLRISIEDNGDGFRQEEAEKDSFDKRRLTGIGLNNVKNRLQLYYGDLAFFTIDSVTGKGTTVQFTLPVSHAPEEFSIKREVERI